MHTGQALGEEKSVERERVNEGEVFLKALVIQIVNTIDVIYSTGYVSKGTIQYNQMN
jgi:hypothetical protein